MSSQRCRVVWWHRSETEQHTNVRNSNCMNKSDGLWTTLCSFLVIVFIFDRFLGSLQPSPLWSHCHRLFFFDVVNRLSSSHAGRILHLKWCTEVFSASSVHCSSLSVHTKDINIRKEEYYLTTCLTQKLQSAAFTWCVHWQRYNKQVPPSVLTVSASSWGFS